MLKFLRKYQKWMLVIFCAVLMAAFLIQPVVSILYPDPGKSTIATVYDGQKILLNDLRQAQADIQFLGQFGQSEFGPNSFGQAFQTLLPAGEGDAERALGWLLMQRAAEHEGILVSQSEAFSLLQILISDVENEEDLEDAAVRMGTTKARLLKVASDFLAGEQFRQLITGVEYRSEENISASPGIARIQRINQLSESQNRMQTIQQNLMDLGGINAIMDFERTMNQATFLMQTTMFFEAFGYPRISAPLMVNAVQSQFAKITGQAVVLDAQPYRVGQAADPERMAELFEKYKDNAPGSGEPMGFGYRIPNRAQVEAIYIPIEQARALAAREITEEQVGEELRRNRLAYNTWQPPEPETTTDPETAPDSETTPDTTEGEGAAATDTDTDTDTGAGDQDVPPAGEPDPNQGVPPQDPAPTEQADAPQVEAPAPTEGASGEPETTEGEVDGEGEGEPDAEPAEPLTNIENDPAKMIQLRAEIRATLVEIRANELLIEIARAVRQEMEKQLLSFSDVGGYRQLPEDFEPIDLQTVADRVSKQFSTDKVTLELVVVSADDRWVTPDQVQRAAEQRNARIESVERRELLVPRGLQYTYLPIIDEPVISVDAPAQDAPDEDPAEGADDADTEEGEETPAPPITPWQALITSQTLEAINVGRRGPMPLPFFDYMLTEKSLRQPNSNQPRTGLQPGVPSSVMVSVDGQLGMAAYVFRITRSEAAHAPKSQDMVEDQLKQDAITAQAYDELLAKKEQLLASAREGNLYSILPEGGTVQELGPFTSISPPAIDGIDEPGLVIAQIRELVDKLREQQNLNTASDADRTIVIELPGEQKLVVFKLNDYLTLSQRRYQREAARDWVASLSYADAMPSDATAVNGLTLETLKKHTGFKATDDYTLGNGEEEAEGTDGEGESE